MVQKYQRSNMLLAFITLLGVVALVALAGFFLLREGDVVMQGQAEATEYRVSGKVPGRILELRVTEGQRVKKGDTLAILDTPDVTAKLEQAVAAKAAAAAQSRKAMKGARGEQIEGAYELWQKALAGVTIMEKSFTRVNNLYVKGVMSAQKKDEAEAHYKAAVATAKAAESQYRMAVNGAEREDKQAAQSLVDRAQGAVAEVESYLKEGVLLAPADGEIAEIFPERGELVGSGAPVMTVADLSAMWVTFNVREDLLKELKKDALVEAKVPALDNRKVTLKVTYLKDLGSYAAWKATKMTGTYDARTFEVRATPVTPVEGLVPGMSVLIE